MTKPPLKILLLDANETGRARLVRTLLRKFPKAVVLECCDAGTATQMAPGECVDVAVVHCTWEMNCDQVLREMRRVAPDVPVLVLSAEEPGESRGGKVRYLDNEQWLLAGNTVAELVRQNANPGE